MKNTASKENILKKIRKALSHPVPLPFPQSEGNQTVFKPNDEELEVVFAREFSALQGKFVYCQNEQELARQLETLVGQMQWKEVYCRESAIGEMLKQYGFSKFGRVSLEQCDAAITGCELLIARTGSIVMSAAQESGRTVSVYAPVHICIAYMNQLVYEVKEGLQQLKEKYAKALPSMITFATGPSRTADIEKTLIVGVHGPKEVFVFLVDSLEQPH
jgi:L-lactate dehydrogenase complex protein LldG